MPPSPPKAPPPVNGGGGGGWWAHHRKTPLGWASAIVAIALAVALTSYFTRRVEPAPSPTPSPSPTVTPPALDESALLSESDAAELSESAVWAITATSTDPADQRGRAACLSTDSDLINPIISMQRSLGSTEDNKLAALHQVDYYIDDAAAQEVLNGRVNSLISCSEVPARIFASATITGVADEAHQLTVVYENEETQYHTVLLTRTGSTLTILDVTQLDEAVPPLIVAKALGRSLSTVCTVGGTCPTDPRASSVVVPATEPLGWLLPSDLPRIRPGIGRWNMTEPGELTSSGMGCEAITLASEPGPTAREQATLVLIQDDATPEGFGLDEMRFTFPDNAAATAFAQKLGQNLAGCQDRLPGTTVTEYPGAESVGEGGVPVTARSFTIARETESEAVHYQLALTISGNHVTYMLATVAENYQFSQGQLLTIAKRLGERATQA